MVELFETEHDNGGNKFIDKALLASNLHQGWQETSLESGLAAKEGQAAGQLANSSSSHQNSAKIFRSEFKDRNIAERILGSSAKQWTGE
mmetsp:Transcript_35986/g.47346  ORF Transcript_35986/g.47346 Transcript_35986/m.47346 type:complete len:89 (-) Transcript_35986:678-944(-)